MHLRVRQTVGAVLAPDWSWNERKVAKLYLDRTFDPNATSNCDDRA